MALYGIKPHWRSLAPPPRSPLSRTPLRPVRQQINVQVLAEEHFDNYDFDLALAVYHERLCLYGRHAKIFFNIGQIHLLLGELIESLSWFRKAAAADPFLAVAHFQLGAVNVRLGYFQHARKNYERCYLAMQRNNSFGMNRRKKITSNSVDVGYDQVGMGYTLRVDDVQGNRTLCMNATYSSDIVKNKLECQLKRAKQQITVDEAYVGNFQFQDYEAIPKGIVSVPAGTIFRVREMKARARKEDPAKTAEWRFRDEARVVAMA